MDSPNMLRVLVGALGLVAACGQGPPEAEALDSHAAPATYVGGTALLPSTASVCWVLGPGSPVNQAELNGVQANISEWTQGDTSLRFNFASNLATFTNLTMGGTTYRTSCTRRSDGTFVETLRLYLDHNGYPDRATAYPNTLLVPGCSADEGIGTQDKDAMGNPVKRNNLFVAKVYLWSMFPQDIVSNQTRCLYTTHLLRGQARNNYLHETGHALGLSHEQDRMDANCVPVASEPAGPFKVTAYDRDSVMHYVMDCTDGTRTVGNWGNTGPSASDRLALEILYPIGSAASIWGHLTGWAGANNLNAASLWLLRGAYPDTADGVLSNFRWSVDGQLVSTRAWPSAAELNVSVGRHTLQLDFRDLWNRQYSGTVVLEQLPSQAAYLARAAAVVGPL